MTATIHTLDPRPATPAEAIERGHAAIDAAILHIVRDYVEDSGFDRHDGVLPMPLLAALGELAKADSALDDIHAALEEQVELFGDLRSVLVTHP